METNAKAIGCHGPTTVILINTRHAMYDVGNKMRHLIIWQIDQSLTTISGARKDIDSNPFFYSSNHSEILQKVRQLYISDMLLVKI